MPPGCVAGLVSECRAVVIIKLQDAAGQARVSGNLKVFRLRAWGLVAGDCNPMSSIGIGGG